MKQGPNIAGVAALIGDPGRANMLTALSNGVALTASELAAEAGVTKQTASSHLAKLADAALIAIEKQGRHRYYRLADRDVALLLESLMGVAARGRPTRVRTGPKEPALRYARVCYDHLAGELGVAVFDSLIRSKALTTRAGELAVAPRGEAFFADLGIDTAALNSGRPLCRACLDWSARRSHLAGTLGAAMLTRFYDLGWARRRRDSRVVEFSPGGERTLRKRFALDA